ncbi:MAG: 30S ribosomal protein S17e [Candidatus Nitrosocaldus sp.]
MNRIRRIAMQLLERYDGMFTTDFESNKELLERIAVFRSKELRNEVAGYITRHVMRRSSAKPKSTGIDEDDQSASTDTNVKDKEGMKQVEANSSSSMGDRVEE